MFYVLNRAEARLTIFQEPDDCQAFLRVLEETCQIMPLPIFALVVMPHHWTEGSKYPFLAGRTQRPRAASLMARLDQSTSHRTQRKWPPSATACRVAHPVAVTAGCAATRPASAWVPRSVPAADPKMSPGRPDPFLTRKVETECETMGKLNHD
jgi:hypothetical protein